MLCQSSPITYFMPYTFLIASIFQPGIGLYAHWGAHCPAWYVVACRILYYVNRKYSVGSWMPSLQLLYTYFIICQGLYFHYIDTYSRITIGVRATAFDFMIFAYFDLAYYAGAMFSSFHFQALSLFSLPREATCWLIDIFQRYFSFTHISRGKWYFSFIWLLLRLWCTHISLRTLCAISFGLYFHLLDDIYAFMLFRILQSHASRDMIFHYAR